jgi:4'-phosphopantetheinyl transferase
VYAFSRQDDIGIDIERIRPFVEMDDIVKRFFSPFECAEFFGLSREKRTTAFFQTWTCKEALVKAFGRGLSCPLDSFSVAVKPNDSPKLHTVAPEWMRGADWSLTCYTPLPGYTAALAAPGCPALKYWTWPFPEDGESL